MNDPRVALAFLGVFGASVAFATWLLRGDSDLAFERSRIETASSAGARGPDSIAASDSISARLEDTGHHCHWHSENRLNSPEWWLAEYDRGLPDRRPTNAQIDELEALLATIEFELNAADTAIDAELAPVVRDKVHRSEFRSHHSTADENRGADAGEIPKKHGGWGRALLPYHYAAEIRIKGLPEDRWLFFIEILEGEDAALDAALDAKATLHHDAPKRIRQLIESFK